MRQLRVPCFCRGARLIPLGVRNVLTCMMDTILTADIIIFPFRFSLVRLTNPLARTKLLVPPKIRRGIYTDCMYSCSTPWTGRVLGTTQACGSSAIVAVGWPRDVRVVVHDRLRGDPLLSCFLLSCSCRPTPSGLLRNM